MSAEDVLDRTDKRMDASVEDARKKLARVRTGRASLAVLDGASLDYYGTVTPLNQVAKLSIPEPTLIVAQPFDPSTIQTVEKAIMAADLGLNPSNDGKVIRIPIPPLTEERRKEMTRVVRHEAEQGRVAVRNIRRDALHDLKELVKEKLITEDDERRAHDEVQKLTDHYIAEIEKVLETKEADLMEI